MKDTVREIRTEIITILDKSGSMWDIRQDTIGGYNGFMSAQRLVPGQARATLVQFNQDIETVYEGVNIAHLGALTIANYTPIGSTALLDAIGVTLTRQGQRIARDGWADKVLINVMTDGEENVSHEYKLDQIKLMVKEYENGRGWAFLFQGADIDAFKVGAGLGISGASTFNFAKTASGVAEAYSTMNTVATSLRTSA